MAFGVSPKFVVTVPLNDLTPLQFLSYAVEAAKRLGWNTSLVEANGFVAYTKSSSSSWSEQVRFTVENDMATIKSECISNQLFDWGKNKRNIREFENEFRVVRETAHRDHLELKPDDISKQVEQRTDQPTFESTATNEIGEGFLSLFMPREGYIATPIIILLNILIFVLMINSGSDWFAPDGDELIKWGANSGELTISGQWWRLLTCCFVHIGVFHLVMNMYALTYVGFLLEPRLGTARFTTAYLFTGIAASSVSLWWHPDTLSAGASGAIFGMYGVFVAMLTTKLIEESTRKALLTSILIFIGYNLLYGLKDGVDNAAHIGGLITGLAAGYAFCPSLRKPSADKAE